MSAEADATPQTAGNRAAWHCLEPWFDPVPASVIGGAKMRHQTPPETAQVEATPQAQALELSPVESLHAKLKRHGRTVNECIELGRKLVELKDSVPIGRFGHELDQLGVCPSLSSRFMGVYKSFSERPTVANAAETESKLFALLPLEDCQLDELERTGCTGNLSLDGISRMKRDELKLAVKAVRGGVNPDHAALLAKLKALKNPH